MNNKFCRLLMGTIVVLAVSLSASASVVTYSGSSGSLAASVTFALTGNTLTVTLSNTSLSDVLVPQDVLLAVWFNATHALTPATASLNGSSVIYGSLTNVGDGWGYYSGLAGGDRA